MSEGLTVLSLFDGISGGQLALHNAGIKVAKYYASEIEKQPIWITRKNFPNTVHLGDVNNFMQWDIEWDKIDLLIGGSPCFVAGTLVMTDKGLKPIEEISLGDMVLTHKSRFRKVLKIGSKITDKVIEIIVGNNKIYTTLNHPFYTKEKVNEKISWTEVKDLDITKHFVGRYFELKDKIEIKKQIEWLDILSISEDKTKINSAVYNLEVEEDNSYTANSIIVHNCQNLSAAGNGKGLAGEQSKLFFKYLEILGWLKYINPNVKFLLENVASMTKNNKELITKYLKEKEPNTEVVMIDSALLSAQRRKRLYWHNFGKEITQPNDKGLVLQDILESGNAYSNKSDTLTASYNGAIFPHDYLRKQRTQVAEPIKEENITNYFRNFGSKGKILLDQQKSSALTAAMGAGGGNIPLIANKVEDKSPALTTTCGSQTGSSAVIMFESINETNYKDQFKQTSEEPKENSKDTARIGNIGSNAQAHRVYSVRGKSVNLSSQSGGQGAKTGLYKIDLLDGDYTIRKLTPIECERLQTLPDNFTALGIDDTGKEVKISNSARYKAIGNGWTTDVIAYIFSFLPDELKNK